VRVEVGVADNAAMNAFIWAVFVAAIAVALRSVVGVNEGVCDGVMVAVGVIVFVGVREGVRVNVAVREGVIVAVGVNDCV
jgi:hypothetical protein